MRTYALALTAFALVLPGATRAADLDAGRVVTIERGFAPDARYYVGRGIYQDSGWAYEVPVWRDARDCRVRIIQKPYGVERIRQCGAALAMRRF